MMERLSGEVEGEKETFAFSSFLRFFFFNFLPPPLSPPLQIRH